ncbi:MAG: FkbM family methyltransferase [Planctomycetaceae bacterium]
MQRFREYSTKAYASVSRRLPPFRGKYRVGIHALKTIAGDMSQWAEPEFFVQLKNGAALRIDVRSNTHLAPFLCGIYDTALIDRFASLFEPDWVVMDVGANVGYYSIPFARRMKELGSGSVHAFEPVYANFDALESAIEKNDVGQFVRPHRIGLGDSKETVGIAMTDGGNTGNAVISNERLLEERGFAVTEEIEIRRLDEMKQLLDIERCDFIKIDIEGAEIFFLRGAREFIAQHTPILYGEFNSYFIERNGSELSEAWDFFDSLGYTCFAENRKAFTFERVVEYRSGISDLLFLPPTVDPQWLKVMRCSP